MFESLDSVPLDPILGMMVSFREDPNPNKVDLSVGVYKTRQGTTPIFDAVKKAEAFRLETEDSKTYIGMGGTEGFNQHMLAVIFGNDHSVLTENRISSALTPGGCGALRVAAELIHHAKPDATVWVSDPTWANHIPLIGETSLRLQHYPYFDPQSHSVDFDAMFSTLSGLGPNDIVLMHAACHNPTGADLSPSQWDQITELACERGFIPFLDSAYQGLGVDLDSDAYGIRALASKVPEMILATSCSKNFGLYRDRTGMVCIISKASQQPATNANLLRVIRGIYSMPPAHGGAIVEKILTTPALTESWQQELAVICQSINTSRRLLAKGLASAGISGDFNYLLENRGMFSFLDLTVEQIHTLRDQHSVYIIDSGRINLAGVHAGNIDYLANAIEAVSL